jgi:hypothetical protein
MAMEPAMSSEPLYRVIYADGVVSTPLPWKRVQYDVACVDGWGVERTRPIAVVAVDEQTSGVNLLAMARNR